MENKESMKEYIARAEPLALNVKYHDIEVTEQETSRRVLNGPLLVYAPEKTELCFENRFQFERAGSWPQPCGRAQQELGRNRR